MINQSTNSQQIPPDSKGMFNITLATWQDFRGRQALVLHLVDSKGAKGKVTLFYKDARGNLLPSYEWIKAMMTVLNIPALTRSLSHTNACICRELQNRTIGLYLHGDNYFNANVGKIYENLAITNVYHPETLAFYDDYFNDLLSPPCRHDYYYQAMLNKTHENHVNTLKELEQSTKS